MIFDNNKNYGALHNGNAAARILLSLARSSRAAPIDRKIKYWRIIMTVDLLKLRMAVLSASCESVDGHRLISSADIQALKLIQAALIDGNYEAAAVEAGATDLSLEVWEAALIAVKIG